MKTYNQWNGSGKDLDQFLGVGDEVDEEMFYYFLEVLPPACISKACVQIGEPHSHDKNGKPTFATLLKTGKNWAFAGNIPTPKNEKCLYQY